MYESRPVIVSVASALLIVDAVLCAVSVDVLFRFGSGSRGWVLPFQPGVWLLALLQVWAAVALHRRVSWVRYAVAAIVLFVFSDSLLSSNWSQRSSSFPAATVRDIVSFVLQLLAVVLLFLPSASRWFAHAKSAPSAG